LPLTGGNGDNGGIELGIDFSLEEGRGVEHGELLGVVVMVSWSKISARNVLYRG